MYIFAWNVILFLFVNLGEFGTVFKFVGADLVSSNYHHVHDGRDLSKDFSNQWLVHLDGESAAADLLAMKLGYKNLGEVSGLCLALDFKAISYVYINQVY